MDGFASHANWRGGFGPCMVDDARFSTGEKKPAVVDSGF
jgi:hypothetical protein